MRRLALSLVLAAAAGCASAPAGTGTGTGSAPHRNPNLVTTEELSASNLAGANLFDALQRIRPNFLRTKGSSSVNNQAAYDVKVRADGVLLGGIESLREISVSEVFEVRYMAPSEAVPKLGTQYVGGAIVVTRRKS